MYGTDRSVRKDCGLASVDLYSLGSVSCYLSNRMTTVARARGHRARMEERVAFQLESFLLVGLILSSIHLSIEAQSIPGYLNIDCGADPYSDAVTNLPWEGDSQYISTGLSGQVPSTVDSNLDNSEALKTFRYFPDRRNKHCYELPTIGNGSFLLRAMFLHGGSSELTLPIEFDVAVNGTTWFTVQYSIADSDDTLDTPVLYEGIFFSAGRLTHFCLVTLTGTPFISSLELRQLDDRMYPNGTIGAKVAGTQYLSNLYRVNCGAKIDSAAVRYPDDAYDRLWKPPGSWSSNFTGATGVAATSTDYNVNFVPSKVMEDAWEYSDPNASFWFSLYNFPTTVSQVYVNFYFEEILSNVTAGDRLFTIDLNGVVANESASIGFASNQYYWNWLVPERETNFTLKARPGSVLGPIVNAVEVHAQFLFSDSATATNDVDTLAALQVSFNLTDWQGDPCYPVSWDWVSCTSDLTPARVEKLLLSNMDIHASIPRTISDLDALTQIHLENNSLYGTIPDSLASLPNLAFLFLNDNNLSGEVPPALITKLGADFDFSGNSLLSASTTQPSKKKSSNVGVVIGAVAGGVLGLGIVIGILLWYCCSIRKREKNLNDGEIPLSGKLASGLSPLKRHKTHSADFDTSVSKPPLVLQATEIGRVSYKTVKIATKDFSVKVGQGSYGSVYHGWLDSREVAVKLNNVQSQQGRNEFITEVDILTRVHHRNLVSLIAYCDEGKELILIYEYQVNGTLQEWLHDEGNARGTLDWKRRLQISADAAKGLEYLHKGCDPTIIHRDVKSSNILLDENMTAKVADFGLSKATPGENTTGYSTGVKGTPGYLDPEYHQLGRLSHKSDVYSFGIVLAEIITGLRPFSLQSNGKPPIILVDRVRKLAERNDMEALADPTLHGTYNPESMWRMADIALSCFDSVGATRPDFTQIVNGISEAIELEKTFSVHSPLGAQPLSFIVRSNSSHGYQNLP